tara:strand:- start:177 stop:380 length:204 start_codon:yes stop_codon:yes gene_type:complete
MKIKLKKDKQIPENSGWCFMVSGYDEQIIKDLNNGKTVNVDKIHKKAVDLISEIKKQKQEISDGNSN